VKPAIAPGHSRSASAESAFKTSGNARASLMIWTPWVRTLAMAGPYSARAVREITNLRMANGFRLAFFPPALRAFMARDKPDG
jgi:hypothetical protein